MLVSRFSLQNIYLKPISQVKKMKIGLSLQTIQLSTPADPNNAQFGLICANGLRFVTKHRNMYALFNLVLLYFWIVQTQCHTFSAPHCPEYDLNLNGEKKAETYTWVLSRILHL